MSIIPIIIPAYEPDYKLVELIDTLSDAQINQPVYIVDDGSGDVCKKIFKKIQDKIVSGIYLDSIMDIKVLAHSVNLGKGRALKYAMNEALVDYPELLGCVTIDSDGQHTIKDMLMCMKALEENPDSLILGCRDFDKSNVPKRSQFGNKMTRRVMQALVGVSISDTQTGLRAIPREFMKRLLSEKGERYEFETNMLIITKECEVGIVEVPIETVYLDENKGSHFNPIKDSMKIYALFGKFIISSLSSSVLDLVLFSVFCKAFANVSFGAVGYIVIATIVARVMSATYNFTINYRTVFKSTSTVKKSLVRYIILACAIMLVSGFAVEGLHGILPVAELAIKIPVDVLLFLASFWIQREFVYK